MKKLTSYMLGIISGIFFDKYCKYIDEKDLNILKKYSESYEILEKLKILNLLQTIPFHNFYEIFNFHERLLSQKLNYHGDLTVDETLKNISYDDDIQEKIQKTDEINNDKNFVDKINSYENIIDKNKSKFLTSNEMQKLFQKMIAEEKLIDEQYRKKYNMEMNKRNLNLI